MINRDEHLRFYSVEPEVTVKVPGVARIFGGFAECSKGGVLYAATEESLFISISKRDDQQVFVHSVNSGETKKFGLLSLKFRKEDHFSNCIKGVCYSLSSPPAFGMNITLGGPVLGYDKENSESAIALGFCLALNELSDSQLTPKGICEVCLRAINGFCQHKCSIVTILAMQNARQGFYMFFDTKKNSLSFIPDSFKDSQYVVLLTRSGIQSTVMSDEREEIKNDVYSVGEKIKISSDSNNLDFFSGEKKKIAQYLVNEYQTSILAEKSLNQKDYLSFGRALAKLGKSVSYDLGWGCPETDWIIKRSSEVTGCLGSSIIFNGSDGVIASVFNRNSIDAYASKLLEYEHYFGLKAKFHALVPFGAAAVEKEDK